jgi:uncharacterized protein YjeT (DUF2065 family)
MPNWAFYTAFLLAASFVMFNGLFMVVAPSKHRRFLAWMSQANSRSRPVGEQGRNGLEIERRLAGAGLAGIGILLTWHAARTAIYGKALLRPFPTTPNSGDKFFPVAVGVCLLAAGIFITFRPQSVVQWNKKHQPISAEVSDSTLANWKNGARLLGVAFMIGAIYTLWIALK